MTRIDPRPRSARYPGLWIILYIALFGSAAVDAAEFSNHAGMRFVDIPAGTFLMGSCKLPDDLRVENRKRRFLGLKPHAPDCSNPDALALDNETPQHEVSVPAFQMGVTEVTLGQYKKYIAMSGRLGMLNEKFMRANAHGDDAPVVWVTWKDAQAFINWLNQSKPASDRGIYRLPSEAEWEYACRAGGHHDYCGSNDANAVAWYYENGGWHAQPVARKQANAFGLYDMSGNVDEWVQDCYHDDYEGAPTNGEAWTSGCYSTGYVLRSNSWKQYEAKYTRAAHRIEGRSSFINRMVGFRVARTIKP
jgi:formylglycine-generating enzyme required for sulfatase activity